MSCDNTKCRCGGLTAIILSLGLIASAYLIGNAIKSFKRLDNGVAVKGYAERVIQSDKAIWTGMVTVRSGNLGEASHKLSQDVSAVLHYLKNAGVKEEGVLSPVFTETIYRKTEKGTDTAEVERYIVRRSITLEMSNVALATKVARETSSLMERGIELWSPNPEYFYTHLNELKLALLEEAARDAKMRAERIVKSNNQTIGLLLSASQGVFQITRPFSTDTSDYGTYDTSTVEKCIKAVISTKYQVR